MSFNIHQKITDVDGFRIEKVARKYQEQLIDLFVQSPEAQTVPYEGYQLGSWANIFMDFAIDYLGTTPTKMSQAEMQEIVFDLFPRKLSSDPENAPGIIRELRAFWEFLQREFRLANAAACLKVLDDNAASKLERAMGNPSNFGIAKSMVMMGKARGFDMTSQEDLDAWTQTYNAELAAGTGLPLPLPGDHSANARKVHDKIKRKMAKGSQKKNRKKK